MIPQYKALFAFLIITIAATATFHWVMRNTGNRKPLNPEAVSKLRGRFAITCTLLLVAALALTLPHFPYPRGSEIPDKVVFVAAKQFAFGLSEAPIANDAQWEAASQGPAVRIPANRLVEFRVTSLDVNHGFGVYSPGGTLLAQTQAMPGYVNRLRLRLRNPGRYPVLCMELCGMEHHSMRGVFEVIPADKD
ncbi:MAG: hypothetical protein IANPNBLG_00285 [Bryobacteraceae bacterium]|nr:hypothetical protein [Bryobacteraceae bacterium]